MLTILKYSLIAYAIINFCISGCHKDDGKIDKATYYLLLVILQIIILIGLK